MQDVAEKAGVSKSTVSQYLNNRFEYMGQNTKEKIKATIDELGYQPNFLARSLKQKKTQTIGVIVANILHQFSTQVTRAVEDFCHKHNYHVIICNADDQPEKEKQYIDMLRAKQVDGLIILPTGENIGLYRELEKQQYPFLFIDRRVDGVNVNNIVLNNRDAAFHAVGHFHACGHERIGMITRTPSVSVRAERVHGFQEGLIYYGLTQIDNFLITTEMASIENEFIRMLDHENGPTALLVGNDLVLMEVLKGVKSKGILIPQQLSIITFDEIIFADLYDPPITTIAQPAYEMGTKAAEILLKQLNDEVVDDKKDHVFEGKLHERQSVSKMKKGGM